VVGLYVPAGTPRPIVDRMNAEVAKAVRSADVTQKFVDQIHLEILASSPEEFASFQKVEQERWFQDHQGQRHQGRLTRAHPVK